MSERPVINTIHVQASRSYDVLSGKGLLEDIGEQILRIGAPKKAMIVSDDNVFPLYGRKTAESLARAGIETGSFVIAHGEGSKCMTVYESLLEHISSQQLTRSDMLVALGGGVTGDLAGFAAATYQRGIRFVQIPTSLLAAVDSSVGGKTAINLEHGKNQVGCFYQPSMVVCDTDVLKTLPEEEFRNGMSEVIKYGMIGDAAFLERLKKVPSGEWIEEVISHCVAMKRDIVARDEYDTGERMLLNFGHTLGHGVESCSGYEIPHGLGVAMGMAVMTRASEKMGICRPGTSEILSEVLQMYHLPEEAPYTPKELADAAMADKKKTGDRLRIVVPEEAGRCVIRSIPAGELVRWAEAGSMNR